MIGTGAKAISARRGEAMMKMIPTRITLTTRPMIAGAPTSRKRSSWLTSSLSTDIRPPVLWSSK